MARRRWFSQHCPLGSYPKAGARVGLGGHTVGAGGPEPSPELVEKVSGGQEMNGFDDPSGQKCARSRRLGAWSALRAAPGSESCSFPRGRRGCGRAAPGRPDREERPAWGRRYSGTIRMPLNLSQRPWGGLRPTREERRVLRGRPACAAAAGAPQSQGQRGVSHCRGAGNHRLLLSWSRGTFYSPAPDV